MRFKARQKEMKQILRTPQFQASFLELQKYTNLFKESWRYLEDTFFLDDSMYVNTIYSHELEAERQNIQFVVDQPRLELEFLSVSIHVNTVWMFWLQFRHFAITSGVWR